MSGLTISSETEKAIKELVTHYPERRAALIPALLLAQKEVGALADEIQLKLAQLLDIAPTQVREVVSFYPMLRSKPVGKCHIEVCRTLSCAMRGSRTIVKKLEDELHIRAGETTPDGMFTIGTSECLAGCGSAPSMLVNGQYTENMDWPKVEAILNRVRKGEKPL